MKCFVMLFLLFSSCSVMNRGAKSNTIEEVKSIESIVSNYPGWCYKEKGEYVVFQKENKPTLKHPERVLQLIVVDASSRKEVYKDQVVNGAIEWVDDLVLKVSYSPGNPEMGKEYFYFYNLKNQKKTTSNGVNEF